RADAGSGDTRRMRPEQAVSPDHPMHATAAPARGFDHLPSTGRHDGYCSHQTVVVTVTVTVGRAPSPPGCPTGEGLAASQSPSPSTRNRCLPSTCAVLFPRTQAPWAAWVTLPVTVMSLPSSVSPSQSTVATVRSRGEDEAPPPSSFPKDAVQFSHRTPALRRSSSSVTVSSVVYATAAELSPPGSHATRPPTASTAPPAMNTGRSQLLTSTRMDGRLPPSKA